MNFQRLGNENNHEKKSIEDEIRCFDSSRI